MKSQTTGLRVASAVFGLVCLFHIFRLYRGFQINVGHHYIGRKLSVITIVVTGLLCIWLWKLTCHCGSDTEAAPSAKP
jgi:hypothetical protein